MLRAMPSRACSRPESRPLRVAADPTYGRVLLSPLVPRFLEKFRTCQLEVALDAQQLAAGSWDVAIRTRPPGGCEHPRSACSVRLRRSCVQRLPTCSSAGVRSVRMTCARTNC